MSSFDDMREFTKRGAEHYGIDPSLAFAMFETESQWNPQAISPAGALGVAQLMPDTAKGLGVNPQDTWENIDGGLRYLKQQLDKYNDPALAIAAYNAGPGAVDKARGIPQNAETPGHVQKVMSKYNAIRMQRFAAGQEPPGEEEKPFDVTQSEDVQGGLLNRVMTGLAEYGAGMLKSPAVMQGNMSQGFRLPQNIEEAKMPVEQWLAKPYNPEEQKSYQLGEALISGARNFLGTQQLPTTLPEQAAEGVGMGLGFMGTLMAPKYLPNLPRGVNPVTGLPEVTSTAGFVGGVDPILMPLEGLTTASTEIPGMLAAAKGLPAPPPILALGKYAEAAFNMARPATLGSAISQVGGYERAREQLGVQDSLDASRWNGLAGLTMGFNYGALMSRIDKGTGGLISSAIKSGIEMTGSMAFMKTLDNVFDKLNYDEKRAILHGVVEGAPADFIVGSLLGALGKTIRQRVAEGKEPELAQEVREYDERSKSWWIKTEHGGWYEEGPGEGPPGAAPPSPPSTKKTYSDSEIEKKVQKVEKSEYGNMKLTVEQREAHAQRIADHYWKEYGIEFRVVEAETPGKFRLERVKVEEGAVPAETPLMTKTIDAEQKANHEENASEIPEDVPPLPEGVVRTKEPLTEQQRSALEAGNAWFRQRQETPQVSPSEEDAGSVNRVDKGVEGKTTEQQTAIDDAAVDAYEKTKLEKNPDGSLKNPKGSYIQAAKAVGLSIAETKARIKYALGQSEKRPYDVVEGEVPKREVSAIESPLIRTETEGRAPGMEAPKMFDSKLEADSWLMDNKMVGTVAPTGGKFKILDMRPAKAYELFSLSPNMYTNFFKSERKALDAISKLYLKGGYFELDPAYNKGASHYERKDEVQYKYDIQNLPGVEQADTAKHIPKEDNSVKSIYWDPLFIARPTSQSQAGMMQKRYGTFESEEARTQNYMGTVREAARVLKPGGILTVKIKDVYDITTDRLSTNSRTIANFAEHEGLRQKAEILIHRPTPLPANIKQQKNPQNVVTKYLIFDKPAAGGQVLTKGGIVDLATKGGTETLFSFSPFNTDPLWFSKLQTEIVKDHANWPKRISGTQMLEKIAKLVQQGKGKKEELDDMLRLTGLKQRLEGMQGVSKDDVLNEIMSNGIEVEERWYGKETPGALDQMLQNYRKWLETFPDKTPEELDAAVEAVRQNPDRVNRGFWSSAQAPKYENTANYNLGGPREGYFELVLTSPQAGEMPSDPSHFIEGKGKRQIGWVRGDWRTDAEGKRILFIEEVQSKRHQEGREEGYKDGGLLALLQQYEDATARDMRAIFNKGTDEQANIAETAKLKQELETRTGMPLEEAYRSGIFKTGTSDAPFRQSWLRLISRRLLRYAAENNADAIAWTTGEQQAERWSLRQVAEELSYDPSSKELTTYNDGLPDRTVGINEKDLPSYVGQDLANQLLTKQPKLSYEEKQKAAFDLYVSRLRETVEDGSLSPGEFAELVRYAKADPLGFIPREYQDQVDNPRVSVPEGVEFYSSKWPEKIYGFQRGGYEKSLLATAMKEAMGQFKGKVGEITTEYAEQNPELRAYRARLESVVRRQQQYPENKDFYETERRQLQQKIDSLQKESVSAQRLDAFSRQPSITLTQEAKDFWRQNPMQMYSLSPNMITTGNVKGIRDLIERNLEFMGLPARGYKADDIGWLESWAAQTQWLVDKNPRLYPIFEATHRKMETASSGHQNAVEPWAEKWVKFSQESKRGATDFEVQLDQEADRLMKTGKTAYGERGITEPRFFKAGRGNITLNPKFHDQWAEKTRPLFKGTDEEFNAVLEHRKMYDKIAETKWNIGRKFYKPGSVEVKQLRHETFMLQDYLPHQRDGEFALTAYVKDAEGKMVKVYDYAFDVNPMLYGAQKMGRKYEVKQTGSKASFGTYRDAGSAEIAAKRLGEDYYVADVGVRGIEGYVKSVIRPKIAKDPALARLQIPEENWVVERRESKYIQSLSNNPLVAMALESTTSKAIREIEKSKDLTPEQKAMLTGPYKKLWNNAIAQTLKKGTLGGHWSHRSGIAGYDVSDAGKIAYNYAEQFYKTLAQAEMAAELTKLAKNIKGDRPNEAKFAARYMERVLSPDQELSKAIAWTRSLAYYTMLNPVKFFGVNITNGLVSGAQQIVVDAGNAAWKQMPKAMWDTMKWYSGTGKLAPMEARLFKELYNNGVARPQFLDAMGQRIKNDPNAKSLLWEQFKNKYSWPARTSEIASRLYTALAAFRAANDGLVTSKRAVDRFGEGIKEKITGEMTEEQYQRNMRYAAKIVDDSHMIWGEINRPDIVTRGPAGKALGSALIFRHYGQGLFHMWKSMLGEGKNGKQAFLQSLAAQSIFGGVVASGIWASIYQQFMGTSMWDDLRKLIGSKATDVVQYGAPTLAGFNLHSSFALEPPDSWDELFGAPASLVKNYKKAWESAGVKDYQKAFEYSIPLKALRDLSVAQRLYTEGLTTAGGSPIPGPGSAEPFKISGFEAAKQVGGFQPLSTTQLWESKLAAQSIDQRRQEAQDGWVTRYVNALRRGDEKEINSVIDEAVAWNEKWIEKGVPQLAVDLGTAIKQRVKPAQPPKRMRGLAREMQERAMRISED